MWFPTSRGVSVVAPNLIRQKHITTAIIIEEMVVDGVSLNLHGDPGAAAGVMKLPPGIKRLEFHYTGVNLSQPHKVKFQLRLDGYDRDWINVRNARSTVYTGLSPGEYTFRVTSLESEKPLMDKCAAFTFYLKPYFYQTTWFYIAVVLVVLLGGQLLHRLRIHKLKSRQKELQALVDSRTGDLKERNRELQTAHTELRRSNELIETKNSQLESQSGALKKLDETKSRFFANISHEFRTPLTLIMGPLEHMIEQSTDEEQKKKMTSMLRNSLRLLGLINQLLELSKFESGTVRLKAAEGDLVPFIKGIAASFDVLCQRRGQVLTCRSSEESINMFFDKRKLEDVMSNLLSNAVKFTPAKGTIEVTVTRGTGRQNTYPRGFVEIAAADTGPGIPDGQKKNVFQRFYQAESTFEHHRKGTGIGLAIVKELVELHSGEIEVRSRPENKNGAEFLLRLPLGRLHLKPGQWTATIEDTSIDVDISNPPPGDDGPGSHVLAYGFDEEEPVTAHAYDVAGDSGGTGDGVVETDGNKDIKPGKRDKNVVLVVEDSGDVRQYIRYTLKPDYIVEEAVDGVKGVKKAREIIPDLIISDIMMPGKDGYQLCRELKTDLKTSHIPIILLTAKADEENVIEGLETGADAYITKPFNTRILKVRIANLIEIRRRLQQELKREMTLQPVKSTMSDMDKEFLKELQAVITKNITAPEFNVEELGKQLYISGATLYRKIRALSGETPTEFIRSCRLKRAAQLLRKGYGSVTEVAFEVGFTSRAYGSATYLANTAEGERVNIPVTYSI
ncbi:MAG: response regulator, partial [bacterium]|nr:response regulator [bacterium]